MATPDVTPYIDLEPFDVEPEDLFDNAIATAAVTIPEWVPAEGNIEVAWLELQAVMDAELVYSVNRLPGAVFAGWLRLFGVVADEGAPPVVTVEFLMSDTLGHDVPSQTRIMLPGVGEGAEELVFETDSALAIEAGDTTGTVTATAVANVASHNGIAAGTVVDVLDPVPYIERATLTTAVTAGRNPEDSLGFLSRGAARLQRLTESLVLPDHFTAYVAESGTVGRVTTVDNTDPGAGPAGASPGHITVAALGTDGAFLTAPAKEALRVELDKLCTANLIVHVTDPTITAVDVSVQVRRNIDYADDEVIEFVQGALATYLSPESWDWSDTVRRNELIGLISQVPGVDFVITLNTPSDDVTLPGVAPLADAGEFTVTVVAP